MPFKLEKSPIVEAWTAFKLVPPPETRGWNEDAWNRTDAFLTSFADRFPERQVDSEAGVKVNQPSSGGPPKVELVEMRPVRFKGKSDDGSRVVQIGHDFLSYHFVRQDGVFPGDSEVSRESLALLEKYMETFRSRGVLQVEWHVLNVFDLPTTGDLLTFEEFVSVYVQMPKIFGNLSGFAVKLDLDGPRSDDRLTMRVLPVRGQTSEGDFPKFRLQWDLRCPCSPELSSVEEIQARLTEGWNHITERFRAAFTDRAWSSFEPTEV